MLCLLPLLSYAFSNYILNVTKLTIFWKANVPITNTMNEKDKEAQPHEYLTSTNRLKKREQNS